MQKLFKDEEVTLGRAAELVGVIRWEFEAILANHGIERVVVCDTAVDCPAGPADIAYRAPFRAQVT